MAPSRSPLVLAFAALATGCAPLDESDPLEGLVVVREDPTDNPLPKLDDALAARFLDGDLAFEAVFRATQGLGPLYIRHACASCHADDAKGPGAVRKMVLVEDDGVTPRADQSLLAFGHTVRPQLVPPARMGVVPPEDLEDLKVTSRPGPAVFGRGYLEAIRDDEIERVAAAQQGRDDGISGRVHYVAFQSEANPEQPFHEHQPGGDGLIGRFGLKARIATLDDFTADAYQGDMGITSPLRPDELPNPDGLVDDERLGADIDAETVNLAADYVRLLAIPRREGLTEEGRTLFAEARCDVCHVPSLRTRDDYPIEPLAGIDAPVFSDLLLHDMGVELADGVEEGDASGREWRTAPLMGLRHLRSYLHDGRAATLREAIEMHAGEGSEANDSVDRFLALADDEQETLLDYLSRL